MKNIKIESWLLAAALACFGVFTFGLKLQYLLALSPCPMCIMQRFILLVTGGFFFLSVCPRLRWFTLRLAGGSAILASAVAIQQSFMQAFPHLVNECSYTEPTLLEQLVDSIGTQWPSLFLATGFCTSKELVIVGLSLANMSAIFFLSAFVFSVVMARKN